MLDTVSFMCWFNLLLVSGIFGTGGIIVTADHEVFHVGRSRSVDRTAFTPLTTVYSIPQLSGIKLKGKACKLLSCHLFSTLSPFLVCWNNGKLKLRIHVGYGIDVFYMEHGHLYVCGRSLYGELGLGQGVPDTNVPTILHMPNKEPVTDVACGSCHTLALTESGKVYSWGFNN